MSQSLFTILSGLNANQSMMDVIADNISNLNTVGFKSSNITFETVFSRTVSAGGVPTENSGGTNPKQIGLGVTLSDISKNFARGTVQSTGKATDLNIQGDGFFSLLGSDNNVYLSRAGNFSIDSEGNLVNPKGLKVLGTTASSSTTGSTTTIKIPESLNIDETNTITDSAGTALTTGDFNITVNGKADTITIDDTDTLSSIVGKINSLLKNSKASVNAAGVFSINGTSAGADAVEITDGATNFATITGFSSSGVSKALDADPPDGDFTVSVNGVDQTVTVNAADDNDAVATAITAAITAAGGTGTATYDVATGKMSITGAGNIVFADGTSNFASLSELDTNMSYSSEAMADNPQVEIAEGVAGAKNNFTMSSYSIGTDGAVSVTFNNGGTLTVTGEDTKTLKYTTVDSKEISGNLLTNTGSVVDPAQLQLQMARVVNTAGLEAKGGNLFALGSSAGLPSYGIAGTHDFGSVESGGLEASNVDLPSEFAKMIMAQRGVEVSSRAFSIEEQMMQIIVNLGR